MKHQIIVKLQVETLLEVELRDDPRFLNSNTDRKTARKLVRNLVDQGLIAADPTFNTPDEDDPTIPEWADVKLTASQYVDAHVEQ